MKATRILPWLFFFPIIAAYALQPDPFVSSFQGGLFFFGIISWVFFMLLTFWQGMLGLIRKDHFDRDRGYPSLISGMNLWMMVLCAYRFTDLPIFILPLVGHLFVFALHFFQTSIFTNQNRTL